MVVLPRYTVLCAGCKPLPETILHMLFVGAIVISYMGLLGGLAVASPGEGLTGTLMEIVPGNWRDEAHIPAYGLLAWLVMWGLRRRGWPVPYAVPVGVLSTIVFGLWTEVAQATVPSRQASPADLLNDLLGGLMAAALMWYEQPARDLVARYLETSTATRDVRAKGTDSK